MNGPALVAAAILPALVLVPLNFESLHGHYAYHLPVAGSTIDLHRIFYTTVEEKDYKYYIRPVYWLNGTSVEDRGTGASRITESLITKIELLDDQSIQVGFGDKGYTLSHYDGKSYKPIPEFSHTEMIRVNQTFITLCMNSHPWETEDDDSTGITIFQYRGIETLEIAKVTQRWPPEEGAAYDWWGPKTEENTTHATRTVSLMPPEKVPVHKFLIASAHTDGRMQCDYPQVIEHTIDSKSIWPDDIRVVPGAVYDMYS